MATATQYEDELTVVAPGNAKHLDTMARFFFASFWCIVFTGSVRKWIFPHISVVYLLQDVPIFLAYIYALWRGLFTRGMLLLGMLLLSVVIVLQGLMQIIAIGHEVFVALVGFHHYLFYLPMLLVFPLSLTEKYRRDFIRWNLWLSIPACFLAVTQAVSPKQAWVNHTSEGDAMGLPGVEVVRVIGMFNFAVFFGLWVAMALALCIGEWLLRRERRVIRNRGVLIASTFALSLCCLVSGSRQTILLCAASLTGGLIASVLLRSMRAMVALAGICILLPVVAGATYLISQTEFEAVQERLTGERGSANVKDRVSSAFYAFLTEPEFSLVGAGVGMGVDASHVGNAESYNFTYQLSEQDIVRNVMELGTPVGLGYLLVRFSFLAGMIVLSIRIVRAGSSPHVLPLSFILFAQAWNGDLTRAATMTSTQVMIGYAFILGVQMYSDSHTLDQPDTPFLTTSA